MWDLRNSARYTNFGSFTKIVEIAQNPYLFFKSLQDIVSIEKMQFELRNMIERKCFLFYRSWRKSFAAYREMLKMLQGMKDISEKNKRAESKKKTQLSNEEEDLEMSWNLQTLIYRFF